MTSMPWILRCVFCVSFGVSVSISYPIPDAQAVVDATEKLDSTDIEGYLAHHHDIIILGAVEDARKASEDDAETMERRFVSFISLCIA